MLLLLRYGIEDVGACFYFNDTYPAVLNETLQAYYDSVEEVYIQDSQVYDEPFEGNVNTPYDKDDSDEKIGEQLQSVLGMDSASMDQWDYYLSETSVVFFYFDPRYWDPVATRRMR